MTEIQGKSILVRVNARFELSGVDGIIETNWIILLVDICKVDRTF